MSAPDIPAEELKAQRQISEALAYLTLLWSDIPAEQAQGCAVVEDWREMTLTLAGFNYYFLHILAQSMEMSFEDLFRLFALRCAEESHE